LPTVSLNPTTAEDRNDSAPGTLGDLLYANRARARVSETEWVSLVKAIAAGDQLALRALYGRMYRIVFTTALRITRSRETAEELTVDVFHEIWRRASTYDPASGTVVGWIMNQARTRAIDRLRFEQRKKRTNPHPEGSPGEISEDGSAQALLVEGRELQLRQALVRLTQNERQAIETAFLSECTYVETAARLRQPVGTIKTRIRSGLAKLRKALSSNGEEP
jgi:RNA polymerase sigma-70 factor, ECF subfamily